MVVEVLLSKEYPIAEIACDEQLGASAERVKGEETWAPLPGLLTVTVANAGLAWIGALSRAEASDLWVFPSGSEGAARVSLSCPRARHFRESVSRLLNEIVHRSNADKSHFLNDLKKNLGF